MFKQLRVVHYKKGNANSRIPICPLTFSGSFFINTCLRNLWIYNEDIFNDSKKTSDTFKGIDAYAFLLRLASGLESEIIGETDIFGQIKDAWKKSESMSPKVRAALTPIMQKLFEDTKEIRSNFIRGFGGTSYGSLVRKLIRERTEKSGLFKPILLVGAGKLSLSIAPWLIDERNPDQEILIYNRSTSKSFEIAQEVYNKNIGTKAKINILEAHEELNAWKSAAHVVVCIPFDKSSDKARISAFLSGNSTSNSERSIIHLGGLKSEANDWCGMKNFFCLDDIFSMQQKQDSLRRLMLEKAREACLERARLRSLGGSLGVTQCWEDLAAFV